MRRGAAALAGAALAVTALAACGDDSSAADAGDQASSVSIQDPWVKAVDSGATAAFGIVTNDGDADVTITGADSEVAGTTQLHETTMSDDGGMSMQEMEGGLTVGAGEDHALEPGGDHVMLMELTEPLEPGAEVEVTLTFADDSQTTFTAPVRSYTGAQEEYEHDHGDDGHDHEHE
ncbi:UNVERIFIED_CONTAM: hypothetical protein LK11_02530 [Mumia flava]